MVLTVICVSENFQNEDISGVEVNGGDEAVMISRDVENGDGLAAGYSGRIGMGESLTYFLEARPFAFFRGLIPRRKGNGEVRVKLGVFIEAAAGDDSHRLLSVVNLATFGKLSRNGMDYAFFRARDLEVSPDFMATIFHGTAAGGIGGHRHRKRSGCSD